MANQLQLTSFQSFSSFENMVSKPTWKDVLLDLISSNSIDPWNVDLVSLADAFVKRVREMKKMDFILQANVILAASILLKYKSEFLKTLNHQTTLSQFDQVEEETALPEPEELPELTLSSRIPPKRQVTVDELITEMEKLINYEGRKRVTVPRGAITETVDLELGEKDIEKDMAEILLLVKKNVDENGWVLFSQITKNHNIEEIVYALLCLLHLVCDGVLDMKQDKMFGEILIHLNKGIEK